MEGIPGSWQLDRPDTMDWVTSLNQVQHTRGVARACTYMFSLSRRIAQLTEPPAEEANPEVPNEVEEEEQGIESEEDEESDAALKTLRVKGEVCWMNETSVSTVSADLHMFV